MKTDVYHDLLVMRWTHSLLLFSVIFLVTNSVFATLFWLRPDSVTHAENSWMNCFYFSVQTFATIGYGHLAPQGGYANLLVTVESALALIMVAIMTGFFFAKFSRATSRIDFTHNMAVTTFEGKRCLMLRLVNIRRNQMIDTKINMTALINRPTKEGTPFRKFVELKLIRNHAPIVAISMIVVHEFDESSIFHGLSDDEIRKMDMEIIVTAIGTDSTFGQTIHAIHSYRPEHFVFNKNFQDMVEFRQDGTRIVDYSKFHLFQ